MIAQTERRAATISAISQAARKLFAAQGFAQTSVDAIATEAGVAKGAVYHHFQSKEEILDHLVDSLQAELAAGLRQEASQSKSLPERIVGGTLKYLTAITAPAMRQILLVDGPTHLGWRRWREIDDFHFGPMIRAPLAAALTGRMSEREIDAIGHLLAGAMAEAALVCATSKTPQRTARDMAKAIGELLRPLLEAKGAV